VRISLLTPSYNQAQFIGRTIDSVLSQRGDFELEYRVIDGDSTDGTRKLLEGYGTELNWVSEPDGGQIDAINRGLSGASGDIVGWINSDDLLLPGALGKVADAFHANPSCRWLFGDCIIIDRSDREIRRWVSAYKRHYARRYSRGSLLSRNFISQMTVFWKRNLIEEVGFLNPEFELAFDYEYWLRLSEVCPPTYLDSKLAAFRWHDSSKSAANVAAQIREDERIARRHGASSVRSRYWKMLQNRLRLAVYQSLDLIGSLAPVRTQDGS
jgi:glycosyltransferase involved in cell wall biosynthesis